MPRSEEVTDELVAQYDSEMDPSLIPLFGAIPRMREAARAGCWIGDRLRAAGASDDDVEQACFAAGQRMFVSPDPWEVAKGVVSRYEDDCTHEQPGQELAQRIIDETR